MPSGIGYGASQGLESVLARLFQESQAKQQEAVRQKQLEMQQQQLDLQRQAMNQKETPQPVTVGGALVDPSTGRVIYEKPPAAEKPQMLTVNGHVLRVGPDGSVADVYAAPEKPTPEKPMVLSEGQVAFGPDGKRLFGVPKTYAPKDTGAGGGQDQAGTYAAEHSTRTLNIIDEILGDPKDPTKPGLISGWSAGPGASLANIPIVGGSTQAGTLKAKLMSLASNISLGELAQMRAASKTGGALGAVSNYEDQMLSNSLGAIAQTQDPAVLRSELQNIKDSIMRWNTAVAKQSNAGLGMPNIQPKGAAAAPPRAGGVRRYNPATGQVE